MACWILGQPGVLEVLREDLLGANPGLGFFGRLEGGGDDVLLQVASVSESLFVFLAQVFERGDGFFLELVEDGAPLFEVFGELHGEPCFEFVPLCDSSGRL